MKCVFNPEFVSQGRLVSLWYLYMPNDLTPDPIEPAPGSNHSVVLPGPKVHLNGEKGT
jgi:hypothetical protein